MIGVGRGTSYGGAHLFICAPWFAPNNVNYVTSRGDLVYVALSYAECPLFVVLFQNYVL